MGTVRRDDPNWRWWRDPWLRVVLHPALLVGPCAALCLYQAHRPGSTDGDVDWAFFVIPVMALVSFLLALVVASKGPLRGAERVVLILVGLAAGGFALVLGLGAWVEAAEVACHGRYECPF